MAHIERVVTHGTFALDGGNWEVENNVWLLGDDSDVVVIDAAHTAAPIIEAVRGRNVVAVVCTHGHNDHVTVAPELGQFFGAPVMMHSGDQVLWEMTHQNTDFEPLAPDSVLSVGGIELRAVHTPGHSPGSTCLYAPELSALFSGDTLFHGGPGATGRSYSDFPTIVVSITQRLGSLPEETVVYTGHGRSTTIGAELAHCDQWMPPHVKREFYCRATQLAPKRRR
ncbi:MBL fold metallo-hydrolase [Mycobacterium sp. E1747]|uniref:MBL fold metallo-hydrolase n=1 Tax=Mycobacterium sp. E1747 TaxID=1834128 RepID=UPI0009EE1E15|nr:MBL fold metallo-hydrolase [Mycobacterium sp. E1747]